MKTLAVLLLAAAAGAQQSSVDPAGPGEFQCPHEFGFYAHGTSCDKYYACENEVPQLKVCGNGLAFDNSDPDFLRENFEPAQSSPNCPRLHGIFADDDDCSVFWNCWGGEGSRYQCGPGLGYNPRSRICDFISAVPECQAQQARMAETFACPEAGSIVAKGSFTRHAHPDDCRYFYICTDGVPREYGCPIGTVFAIGEFDGEGFCTENVADVPGCEDYYGDLDLKALKGLGL